MCASCGGFRYAAKHHCLAALDEVTVCEIAARTLIWSRRLVWWQAGLLLRW
jgi:hypothetical protein